VFGDGFVAVASGGAAAEAVARIELGILSHELPEFLRIGWCG
jgi:hypothetical protein